MNVLHITPKGFLKGIMGLYELNLCDFLRKSGVEVKAITLSGDEIRDYVISLSRSKNIFKSLIQEQLNLNCDVVHIHSAFWSEFPYVALLLTRLLKRDRPSIMTTHAFDTTKIKRPIALLNDAYRFRDISYLGYAFRITSYYYVKHIIAMSNRESAYLINELGIDESKISVIPNGVDLTRFSKWYHFREHNSIEEDFVILYVGQLTAIKGISYLVDAFKQLLTAGHDCRLIVITRSGPDELLQFSSLCKKFGILNRVTVFSQLNGDFTDQDLISAYKCCDVFVLPSLQECSPGVILEAMAASKPVVTTTVVPEIVQDGYNGFLVQPKNPSQLARKLSIVLSDRNLRITMGTKGFTIARNKYDWNLVGSKILELYKEIVD
jgi:glycosyltransferase involved in cell wall biosynthesis